MPDWKIFFNNNKYHAHLTNSALLLIAQALQYARKHQVISEQTLSERSDYLAQYLDTDLGTSVGCFSMRIPLLYDPKYWRETQISSLMWLVSIKAKENGASQASKERFEWSVREAESLFRYLKLNRNSVAHDLTRESTPAFGLLVATSVRRILEICPRDKTETSIGASIIEEANSQIQKFSSFQMVDIENDKLIDESSIDVQEFKALSSRLDKIQELLSQSIEHRDNLSSDSTNSGNTYDNNKNKGDESNSKRYSTNDLRDELRSLKEDCESVFEEHTSMGYAYNFFQGPIVEEIMRYKPYRAEEILRLPDVGWRVQQKSTVLGRQFTFYRDRLDRMLQMTDWD